MLLGIYQVLISVIFLTLGIALRQREMAASRLSCLRFGCCALFFPPRLPILRKNSLIVVLVVFICANRFALFIDLVKLARRGEGLLRGAFGLC